MFELDGLGIPVDPDVKRVSTALMEVCGKRMVELAEEKKETGTTILKSYLHMAAVMARAAGYAPGDALLTFGEVLLASCVEGED